MGWAGQRILIKHFKLFQIPTQLYSMRNLIKPLAEKRGLKRPCRICNKSFQPTGRFQRCCFSCNDNQYIRRKEKKDLNNSKNKK